MKHRALGACALLVSLVVSAPPASATFPGRNGVLALPVDHIPYVIGIAQVMPSRQPLDIEGRRTSFFAGCQLNTDVPSAPCPGGRPVPAQAGRPSFSRNGRELVFDDGSRIEFARVSGSGLRTLTPQTSRDTNPSWFPDGTKIAFTGRTQGRHREAAIFSVTVRGTGLRRLALGGDDAAVSPGGRRIAFDRPGRHGHRDVWLMRSDGSHQHLLARDAANPCFAPDGRKLVFAGTTSRGAAVIERIDVGGTEREIIARQGNFPVWSPDGRLIAYSSNSDQRQPDEADLFVVPAAGGPRKRIAFDDPISEDFTEFHVPDWQARAG
jgi:Tol biopolymer transport system component